MTLRNLRNIFVRYFVTGYFVHCVQIIDNIGNWLNYVATLSLVEQLAGGKGLLISALIIVRFLPSFLMFPLAGVVADRQVLPPSPGQVLITPKRS